MTTKETKKIALEMYPTSSMTDIIIATGLTICQIKHCAQKNKVRKIGYTGNPPHYHEHIQEILQMYPTTRNSIICEKFNITRATLSKLACKNGVRKKDKYSNVKEFIIDNYQKMTNAELAKITGITESAVGSMASHLKIKKKVRHLRVPEYYKYKDEILRRYPTENNESICKDYGITNGQLISFVCRNGVAKQPKPKVEKELEKPFKPLETKALEVEAEDIKEDKPSELELAGFFDADKFFKQF